MGAYVPIFKKIHKLLLPFAYYFCSNILLDLGDLQTLQTLQNNARQDNMIDDRLRDMINMISHQKLFKPVQTNIKKDRDFYHIQFRDKGLDHINISQILRNKSVTDKIPIYFIILLF